MGDSFAYSLNSVSVSSSEEESTSGSRQSSWPTTGAVDDSRPETASEILARLQAQRAQELSDDDREDVAEPTEGGSPRVSGSGRASPVFNSELGDPLSSISSFDDDRLRRSDASEGGAAPAGAVGRTPTKVLGRLNEHASGGGEPHDATGYSSSTTASDAGAGYGSDDFDEEDDEDGAADGDNDDASAPAAPGAAEDSEEGEASLLAPVARPASPVERAPRASSTSPVDVQVVPPLATVRDSADSFLSAHGGAEESQQRAASPAAAAPAAATPTVDLAPAAVGAPSSPILAARRESECDENGSASAAAPGAAPIVALNTSRIDAQAAQSAIGVDDGYDTSEEAELREKEAFFAKQQDLVAEQQTLAAAAAVADGAISRRGEESDASMVMEADISVAPPLPQSMLGSGSAPQRSPSPAHRHAPSASPAVPDPSPNGVSFVDFD